MVHTLQKTNLALARRIVQGLSTNDMRPLIEVLDDNVEWKSNPLPPYFRFGGEHLNRGGVMDLLAKISSEYSFTRYELDDVAETGDQVWGICDVVAHHRPTAGKVSARVAFRMTFRSGKLATYEGFFDTAGVLQQQGRLPLPPE